ncbi:MAG: hypothetical protein ACYDEY_01680 [Acidimicrobiales bacterium]
MRKNRPIGAAVMLAFSATRRATMVVGRWRWSVRKDRKDSEGQWYHLRDPRSDRRRIQSYPAARRLFVVIMAHLVWEALHEWALQRRGRAKGNVTVWA